MLPMGNDRRFGVRCLLVLVAFSVMACGRRHVSGTVAVDSVLKAWTAEGFDTGGVLNVEPDAWNAGACARGAVAGLEVLLCEYATDDALAAGEKKVMGDWEGESLATGATARSSRTLLAIADRTKADPNGRTIARLVRTFRAQR